MKPPYPVAEILSLEARNPRHISNTLSSQKKTASVATSDASIDKQDWKKQRSSKRVTLFVLLLVLVGGVGFFVGFLVGAGVGNEENENENNNPTSAPSPGSILTLTPTIKPTGSPTEFPTVTVVVTPTPTIKPTSSPSASPTVVVTPTPTIKPTLSPSASPTVTPGDFCAPLNVTDNEMRILLRDGFDDGLNQPFNAGRVVYLLSALVCLPSNAWSLLDNDQRLIMINLGAGIRIQGNLELIHPDAFDPTLVSTHVELNLAGNRLSSLPDFVFRNFLAMETLIIGNNPFVTLSNNIFDETVGSPTLRRLAMNQANLLINFPEIMLFTPNLVNLELQFCTSLATFNAGAFANIANLNLFQSILITSDVPIISNPGVTFMANALDIQERVFSVRIVTPTASPTPSPTASDDFCADLGITDAEVRQVLVEQFDGGLNIDFNEDLLFYQSRQIVCLPENAWSDLSLSQRATLINLNGIRVSNTVLQRIHPSAFDPELVASHTKCNLDGNKLSALPDNLFRDFGSMESLTLSNNDFETISNNIFDENDGSPSLTALFMNSCAQLINFPEILLFTPNVRQIQLANAVSLADFNQEVFENFTDISTLFQILLSADVPVVTNPGTQAMADALGISVNVFQVLS